VKDEQTGISVAESGFMLLSWFSFEIRWEPKPIRGQKIPMPGFENIVWGRKQWDTTIYVKRTITRQDVFHNGFS